MNISGKRVLVTGADGFIGSHLVESLLERGCQVRALSYYNSFNYWGWLEDIKDLKKIEVVSGDVRDPFFCKKITKDIDIVFHLAALIAIPYSYVAPESYIQTNIQGTLNISMAALENNVSKVMHTSTSEVYGTAKYVPINEEHPVQPQSPYSASKIGADSIAMSMFNAYKLPLVIARPFNTFGPRQSARAVIPNIISQIQNGNKEIELGDVTPTRDFNYVSDTCLGMITLMENDAAVGDVYNIGSGTEISIENTFKLIKKMMESECVLKRDEKRVRPENSEVFRLVCDNSKIKKLSNFKSTMSFEEGIRHTIKWFKNPENLKKYKTHIYNI